jgi:steroid delta-isomerase-like uncharacterized protein
MNVEMKRRASRVVILLAAASALGACGERREPAVPATTTGAVAPAPGVAPTAAAPSLENAPPLPRSEVQLRALRAWAAAFDDAKRVSDVFAEDALVQTAGAADARGRAAIEQSHQALLDGFPDLKNALAAVYLKGDVGIAEWVMTGTQTRDWMCLPASNKPFGIRGATVFWFDDQGLVREAHRYFDMPTLYAQIGAFREKVRPRAELPADTVVSTAGGSPDEEANLTTLLSLYAALDETPANQARFLGLFAENATFDDVSSPASAVGRPGLRAMFRTMTRAFPDLREIVANAWGVGDTAAAELVFNGTQRGPLGAIKPTGRGVNVHELDVAVVKNGKILRATTYMNSAEALTQLGVAWPPDAPVGK